MKTKNMPHATYLRRVVAFERLDAARKSSDHNFSRYAKSPAGQYEFKVLDERIKAYAESGQRPSKTLRPV